MNEEAVKQGLNIYERYGLDGLFVVVFIALCLVFFFTVRMFLRKDASSQKEMIITIKDATVAQRDCVTTLEAVKKSLDESAKQSAETLIYMKARDQFFGKGPRT